MHRLDQTNLALGALALVLACLLWWFGRGPPAPWPQLTGLAPAQVHQLELFADERLVWRLLRDPAGWTLTHPEVARASSARVGELLGLLRTPSLDRFPAVGTLAPYGLDAPRYRLVVEGRELAFGGLEPTTGHRYVRVDDMVHLIGDGFYHHLAAAPERWRASGD
ncbi:MAG: DUF4340 domain-containing protein [Gammaproteobacteria bacterium]|jgi:hypothetical protein